MISFTAHCARNHDRVDFTDPTEFERHMTTEHKKRKLTTRATTTAKPRPWKAPKCTPGGLERVIADLEAGCEKYRTHAPRGLTDHSGRPVLSVVTAGEVAA